MVSRVYFTIYQITNISKGLPSWHLSKEHEIGLYVLLAESSHSTDKSKAKTASFYHSKPSKWLAGRSAIVPAAHVLGGGSSINFLVRTTSSLLDGGLPIDRSANRI